ncbi:MAG: hypothetical protein AB7I37_20185 [Pirellulales bacterium]
MLVTRFATAAVLTLVSLSALQAHAQYIDNRASTPIQGILYGEAEVIRAHGTYNKLTSEAANIDQDTYSKALDNNIKAVEYFYKKKEIHDYAIKKMRKPPLSPEARARINKARAPKRLDRTQIDPDGNLYWPATLTADEFAAARLMLDDLFAERAEGLGGLGTDNYRQIQAVARQLKSHLRQYVKVLGPTEYMQSSKFIDRLSYESRFAMEADGLASN